MKAYLLIFIFALISCQEIVKEDNNKFTEMIKCFVNHAEEMKPEIFKLIDAIDEKNIPEILTNVQALIEKTKEAIQECIKKTLEQLNIEWSKFGKCILKVYAGKVPTYIEDLISAIKKKDWKKVAVIAAKLVASGIGEVIDCMAKS